MFDLVCHDTEDTQRQAKSFLNLTCNNTTHFLDRDQFCFDDGQFCQVERGCRRSLPEGHLAIGLAEE